MTETDDKWTHQKRETKTLPIHNKEQCFDMALSSNLKLNDHRKLKKKESKRSAKMVLTIKYLFLIC